MHRTPFISPVRPLVLVAVVSMLVACDRNGNNSNSSTGRTTTPSSSTTPPTPTDSTKRTTDTTTRPSTDNTTTPKAPDNTAQNERDRNTNNPTPGDQGESDADRKITASIRSAVMADSGLSVNARNCKIITKDGAVTLRGPVASQSEKDAIEAKAHAVGGVKSVDNQLEIAPK